MGIFGLVHFIVLAGLFGVPADLTVQKITRPALPDIAARDLWPKKIDAGSLGVEVSAKSAIVADRDGGKVLFAKRADEVRPIASITKLMTVLVALSQGLSENDPEVRNLIFEAITISENESALRLARLTGLSEDDFVHRMNERALALGMYRTRFVDPTGLDPDNRATARELITLLQEAGQYESVRAAMRMPQIGRKENTNLLLGSFLDKPPFRIILGKTGSLDEAGFCLAALADNGDNGVYIIVLDSDNHFSRFEDAKALIWWAFTKWHWPRNSAVSH